MKWEQIDNYHRRCKIYGGWIFESFEDVIHQTEYNGLQSGFDFRVAVCFIPDKNHKWKIES